MNLATGLLHTAVLAGGVPALAALGEVLTERVGVINLGVEGLMALGAITAVAIVVATRNPTFGLLGAVGVGLAIGTLFALVTVIVRANQVLCGLALTMLGTGLAAALGKRYAGTPVPALFGPCPIPYLSRIPVLGEAFFSQNMHLLLFRTRHGLNLRAVGENPAAADAAGIPVQRIRYLYVSLGAGFATAAGAYLTLCFVPSWSDGVVAGRGWIAVALVIFAGFRPINAVLGALLFGLTTALGFLGQARNWPVAPPLLSMLPYAATLMLIVMPAAASPRVRRLMAAPAALGVPYFRDER
jgi:simple sugar transport system permease protein